MAAIPAPTRRPGNRLELPAFLDVESGLYSALVRLLLPVARGQLSGLSAAVDRGDWAGAAALVAGLNFREAAEGALGKFEFHARAAATFGAALWAGGDPGETEFTRVNSTLDEVARDAARGLAAHLDGQLNEELRADLQRGLEELRRRREDAELQKAATLGGLTVEALASDLNRAVDSGVRLRAALAANVQISRLVAFGALHEAQAQGFGRWQWTAELDDKTCPVCRGLHGRVFGVDRNLDRLRTVIRSTPETAKALAPWPRQTKAGLKEFASLSDEEVQERGHSLPPAHAACWTPDHQIFTARGWMAVGDVTSGDEVWTLVPETRELRLDRVQAAWHKSFDGYLVQVKSRTLDLLVTPDHALVGVTDWKFKRGVRGLSRVEAGQVGWGFKIPRIPESWAGETPFSVHFGGREWPAQEFMAFLGWYLSEGSCSKPPSGPWQVKISQEKPEGRAAVGPLMHDLFDRVWEAQHAFYAPIDANLAKALRALGKVSSEKRVPRFALRFNVSLLQALFEALVAGDGSRHKSSWQGRPDWNFGDVISFSSSSPGLVDDVTEVALKIGLRPAFSTRAPREVHHRNGRYTAKREQHVVSFGRRSWSALVPRTLSKVLYSGSVVGIQMETNPVVLVRRNGKTAWTGNCRCVPVKLGTVPVQPTPGGGAGPEATPAQREAAASTEELFRGPSGWDPARVAQVHDPALEHFLAGKSPVPSDEQPVVRFLGGGSGAGKGTIQARGLVRPSARSVLVDPDEIKGLIPEYAAMAREGNSAAAAFAHEESSHLGKELARRALSSRRDVVLDGTGDGGIEKLAQKVEAAKRAGHQASADYVTIPTDEAAARAMERAQRTGRLVPERRLREIHRDVSRDFALAVERRLFDDVRLWDNFAGGGEPVLVMEQVGGRTTIHRQDLWDDFLRKADEDVARAIYTDAQFEAVERAAQMRARGEAVPDDFFDYVNTTLRPGQEVLPPVGRPSTRFRPERFDPNARAARGTDELLTAGGRMEAAPVDAYREYTRGPELFYEIQAAARGVRPATAEVARLTRDLDAYVATGQLTEDVVAYRGVAMNLSQVRTLRTGAQWVDDGFSSTTTRARIADTYASESAAGAGESAGTVPVVFRIRLPKGARAAEGHRVEGELLLPRGMRFEVVGRQKYEGGLVVDVRPIYP